MRMEGVLYEFLQPVAFKLPAHLCVASYTIYAYYTIYNHVSGLFSGCGICFLILIPQVVICECIPK